MGKIVVTEFVTLDGVMEAPGGEPGHPHTGWASGSRDSDKERHKFKETSEAESLLIGRVTYESFAGAWPHYKGEFADKMNSMPKYVVSTTLRDPEWNNTSVISGDIAAEVRNLRESATGTILVAGSRTLAQSLMALDLVDEYRLMIFPVVLGSGLKLFPESPDKIMLRLVDTKLFSGGIVEHTYQPASR